MSGMAGVLAEHRELAWNHVTGQAVCGDCDAPLGPFTAEIEEQNHWLREHVAAELSAAGFGPVREQAATIAAVRDLANSAGRCGWRISADDIRTALGKP